MTTTTLTKTRSVLDHWGGRVYVQLPEEGETARGHIVSLDRERWEDMGQPATITVTIEPGDRLNEVAV